MSSGTGADYSEAGEAPHAAAERELHEETGLSLRCAPVNSRVAAAQEGLDVSVFAAEVPPDSRVTLSVEHDRYEWVRPEDLSRCLPGWVHEMYVEVLGILGVGCNPYHRGRRPAPAFGMSLDAEWPRA